MTVVRSVAAFAIACAIAGSAALAQSNQPGSGGRIYNTARQKLNAGKQIVGGTIQVADPDIYCAMANSGYDFLWIEMQHSPMTYQDVARMVWACRGAAAMPFVRVPDATEGDIQKATDLGALGIIIPMVESVEKVRNAVKFAKYPPIGLRSQGAGQYRALWGADYRETANDNIMIVAMIESPTGVEIADKIAAVPGVDVVFVASTDLGSFSGYRQGDPRYEALVTRVHDATLKAGLKLGGPQAWRNRSGFTFFQGANETALIPLGVKASLGGAATAGPKPGVAPIEGEEKK